MNQTKFRILFLPFHLPNITKNKCFLCYCQTNIFGCQIFSASSFFIKIKNAFSVVSLTEPFVASEY